MEFYDVNFSYIDKDTLEEKYVTSEEQGVDKIIPPGLLRPEHPYTIGVNTEGKLGAYKIETEMTPGTGKFKATGIGSKKVNEAVQTVYNYLKSNSSTISNQINTKNADYLMQYKMSTT